ncbi:hypothetical protein SAMN05216480_12318 [Pustulibacterium marinum]|uniref:YD repeat-containing protein n=1 Tax=Pustulibacterium marinum TaxID=1224947 RepID=A0A1I7IVY8_9FLAO|nr:hypothetical protein [Pustulibacterium marinum]SFU77117.1 hypothetical protein SAMN05216480_12318 [Pustulibacterium marinum]
MKNLLTILALFFCLFTQAQGNPTPLPNGLRVDLTKLPRRPIDSVDLIAGIDRKGVLVGISKYEVNPAEYTNYTFSINRTPSSGERGVVNSYSINYNLVSNNDSITTATISQGVGNVLANVDQGTQSITGLTTTTNITYTLSINYERLGVSGSNSTSTTFNTYVPQWAGTTTLSDFDGTYATIEAQPNVLKYIQNNDNITRTMSPANEYIVFVSTNGNATIKDGNGFAQSVGSWGDATKEFQRKTITLSLADGSTTTAYFYRTTSLKTFTNLDYSIE